MINIPVQLMVNVSKFYLSKFLLFVIKQIVVFKSLVLKKKTFTKISNKTRERLSFNMTVVQSLLLSI